jgi:hypothetical protein
MNRRSLSVLGLVGLACLLVILHFGYGVFTSAPTQPRPDLSRGLIGHWTFDSADTAENTSNGSNGQRLNGALANGLPLEGGKIGQAAAFHGGTDYVDTGGDFIPIKAMTLSAWVYARSNGGLSNGRILDNGTTVLKIPNSDRFTFSSNGLVSAASSESGSLNLNTWLHVVVTRTSSGIANFYINGMLSGTANQHSGTPVAGVGNVSIGNGTPAERIDVGWDGLIDEVRIYDRVLTTDEITLLYNMGR